MLMLDRYELDLPYQEDVLLLKYEEFQVHLHYQYIQEFQMKPLHDFEHLGYIFHQVQPS